MLPAGARRGGGAGRWAGGLGELWVAPGRLVSNRESTTSVAGLTFNTGACNAEQSTFKFRLSDCRQCGAKKLNSLKTTAIRFLSLNNGN